MNNWMKHIIIGIYLRIKLFIFKSFVCTCTEEDKPQPKISLLIPFSSNNPIRKVAFHWLLKYWRHELPDAEIIIGHSNSKIFCKNEALNDAARQATGKVLVILDADAYLCGSVIERCADRILEELKYGNHLWYVPYRHLYRLNKHITNLILKSDPENPLRLPSPLPPEYIQGDPVAHMYGHRFAAMIMIFPREALDTLGCFDERFKGWGGEDSCLMRALDTLWGKHKTANNSIYHLWHPFIGNTVMTRKWEGQEQSNVNARLGRKYHIAFRRPGLMRQLVDEACDECKSS
jgi:hypothetical protein